MTVGELQQRISSYEITEWMAYEALEGPLDPNWRRDFAAATVTSQLAEPYRDKKKKHKPFRNSDFMPDWYRGWRHGRKKARRQTPEEQMSLMKKLTSMMAMTKRH